MREQPPKPCAQCGHIVVDWEWVVRKGRPTVRLCWDCRQALKR